MKSEVLKGGFLVALGACCYGMLGSFVKIAYLHGFTTAEVVLAQFTIGFAGLFMLIIIRKQKIKQTHQPDIKSKIKLTVSGTSLGLTSIFYYMAVRFVPVSIGIVLLMQTVWISVALESVLNKRLPGLRKVISALLVMIGTILATRVLQRSVVISREGMAWGLLSAFSYTATMYSSNNVAPQWSPLTRSFYMILGGLFVVIVVFHGAIHPGFSYRIFLSWGLLISLFGTILPPLLFTRGMPATGIGLGAIIAALEIPVGVLMATWLLGEPVKLLQWTGIALILAAVVLMNLKRKNIAGLITIKK